MLLIGFEALHIACARLCTRGGSEGECKGAPRFASSDGLGSAGPIAWGGGKTHCMPAGPVRGRICSGAAAGHSCRLEALTIGCAPNPCGWALQREQLGSRGAAVRSMEVGFERAVAGLVGHARARARSFALHAAAAAFSRLLLARNCTVPDVS